MKPQIIPQSVLDRVKAIEEARASGVRTILWAGTRQQGSTLVHQLLNTKDTDMQLLDLSHKDPKKDRGMVFSMTNEEMKNSELTKFKAWVENTKLFQTIVAHSGNPSCEGIEGFDFGENNYLMLEVRNRKITTFEELSKELLREFFINSPWYNPREDIKSIE